MSSSSRSMQEEGRAGTGNLTVVSEPAAGATSGMHEPISLTANQELRGELAGAAFHAIALRDRLDHVRRASFPAGHVTLEQLLPLGDVELAERREGGVIALLRIEPRMIVLRDGSPGSGARSRSPEAIARPSTASRTRSSRRCATTRRVMDRIPFTFWAASRFGVSSARRRLEAPRWDDDLRQLRRAAARRARSAHACHGRRGSGRLLLLHGEPGTGKSYRPARAGAGVGAMVRGPLHHRPRRPARVARQRLLDPLLQEIPGGSRTARPPWRLLILEDAGELLAADARATAGQALSRLLNITDGLLGEGLARAGRGHHQRAGREAARGGRAPGALLGAGGVGPLAAPDADAWLAARGAEPAGREATLAELFALAGGRAAAAPRRASWGSARRDDTRWSRASRQAPGACGRAAVGPSGRGAVGPWRRAGAVVGPCVELPRRAACGVSNAPGHAGERRLGGVGAPAGGADLGGVSSRRTLCPSTSYHPRRGVSF